MHILFVDESGTPPKPTADFSKQRYFVIGGAVVHEAAWQRVREKLLGLKARRRIRGEFKWRYFAPGNADERNPMRALDQFERDSIRAEIFDIINKDSGVTCLACVADAQIAYSYDSTKTADELYHAAYKPVTERFQYFLQEFGRKTHNKEFGIVVCDHRGANDDKRLRQHHDKLLYSSSEFTSRYNNLVESVFLQPSNLSVGIQLADMVAGAVWRKFEKNDDRYFNLVEASFRRSKTGQITGFGVVMYPKIRKDAG
ncbi:DUF3800 domain-containing protein [Bosea sp. (in: a-proteobacteria)]|uniref:DUF3800 domain-containing protein n=1 Tax=Bosea sp. (in: a-proteobacteria) TaxID=1871050 RepID=UPI0012243F12|nr:DUF3800 domain-containing protein [Bosea sp. (in: a-proteobacteria)]TAJ34406.1 MAG: DUF3800 domain-containing protein [Bosea sp. (in: a-proteobacteria)]